MSSSGPGSSRERAISLPEKCTLRQFAEAVSASLPDLQKRLLIEMKYLASPSMPLPPEALDFVTRISGVKVATQTRPSSNPPAVAPRPTQANSTPPPPVRSATVSTPPPAPVRPTTTIPDFLPDAITDVVRIIRRALAIDRECAGLDNADAALKQARTMAEKRRQERTTQAQKAYTEEEKAIEAQSKSVQDAYKQAQDAVARRSKDAERLVQSTLEYLDNSLHEARAKYPPLHLGELPARAACGIPAFDMGKGPQLDDRLRIFITEQGDAGAAASRQYHKLMAGGPNFLILLYLSHSKLKDQFRALCMAHNAVQHYGSDWQKTIVIENEQYLRGETARKDRELVAIKGRRERAERAQQAEIRAATEEEETRTRQAIKQHATAHETIRRAVSEGIRQLRQECREVSRSYATADWQAPDWSQWQPASAPAPYFRIGQLSIPTPVIKRWFPQEAPILVPALLPCAGGKAVLLEQSRLKDKAVQAVQSAMLRLFASLPPGRTRFTIFDPVDSGRNAADFMQVKDIDDNLITGKAWTETPHMEKQLSTLCEHMETLIQQRLRQQFQNIEQYNAQAEVAEPYRILVIFDFPHGFNDSTLKRLFSLIRNGPRCGIYPLICCDMSKSLPHGIQESDFKPHCFRIGEDAAGMRMALPELSGCILMPDSLPEPIQVENLLKQVANSSKNAARIEVDFDLMLQKAGLGEAGRWKGMSIEGLEIPLGPAGVGKTQSLVLDQKMEHQVLIAGRSGSGKTNLMHVIICALGLKYPPEELQLYLIDFKKGVGFKPYAKYGLPHARAIAIESEREFGLSVLEALVQEDKERNAIFRQAGTDNLIDYRKDNPTEKMPRLLLIVDEFQVFFSEDDTIARKAHQLMEVLIKQGRSAGIHLILGTQTLADARLSPSVRGQIGVRIALPCEAADSELILGEGNRMASRLSRQGEAIYNPKAGAIDGNSEFQVALFKPEDMTRCMKWIQSHRTREMTQPRIFEAHEPSHLSECVLLAEAAKSPKSDRSRQGVQLWLGEPVGLQKTVGALLQRQIHSHLLIITRDETQALGALCAVFLSVSAQQRSGDYRFFLLNAASQNQSGSETLDTIAQSLPVPARVVLRSALTETLMGLVAEMQRRRESRTYHENIYLVFAGIQRVSELRAPEGRVQPGSPEAQAEQAIRLLTALLTEGPDVGIHVIATCDSVAGLERVSRSALREFALRAVGQMGESDMVKLTGSRVLAGLEKPYRMAFYDDERPNTIEKFRSFEIPDVDWARSFIAQCTA